MLIGPYLYSVIKIMNYVIFPNNILHSTLKLMGPWIGLHIPRWPHGFMILEYASSLLLRVFVIFNNKQTNTQPTVILLCVVLIIEFKCVYVRVARI